MGRSSVGPLRRQESTRSSSRSLPVSDCRIGRAECPLRKAGGPRRVAALPPPAAARSSRAAETLSRTRSRGRGPSAALYLTLAVGGRAADDRPDAFDAESLPVHRARERSLLELNFNCIAYFDGRRIEDGLAPIADARESDGVAARQDRER